ncbi:MAG: type I-D CRISPR-associated protein Cas7/Csc2 [Sulfolobales archaeon]
MSHQSVDPVKKIEEFLRNNSSYLRNPAEQDRIFAKGRKIEVVYVVVSKGIPLFRTEGAGDVTTIDITLRKTAKEGGSSPKAYVSVPAILPEKMQAKLRRRMLEVLRSRFSDKVKEQVKRYREQLKFTKLGESDSWNCFIMPPSGEKETDLGMCGFCPSCNILGAVITKTENTNAKTSYGIKSRVVHDIAFATVPYEKCVVDLTHNKVGDGVSYTGKSLYGEPHVVPGVVFVGKLAMYDVTEREAKLVLHSLATISRMGGGETKYGSVQVIVVGLKAGDRETVSSYDIARHVLEETGGALVEPEAVIRKVVDYIKNKGFDAVVDGSTGIDSLDTAIPISDDELAKLWEEDNYRYSENVVKYITRAEGTSTAEGSEKKGGRRGKKSRGAEEEEDQ